MVIQGANKVVMNKRALSFPVEEKKSLSPQLQNYDMRFHMSLQMEVGRSLPMWTMTSRAVNMS